MSAWRVAFYRFFWGMQERTPVCGTNTQFLLQLSGYRWVADMLGPLPGKWILDAASGEGFGSEELARRGGRVIAVDIDRAVLARGVGRHPAHFVCMDIGALGLQDRTMDLIISEDTLEHVRDDVGFVRELHRVLKPDGVLVIMTPHSPVHTLSPVNLYHVREYSKDSLLALLAPFFRSVQLFGRRAGAAMRAAEAEMDQVRRYDRLGIRRLLVPRWLRHRMGSWLLRRRGRGSLQDLSAADVEFFPGVEGSGVLIAVCQKQNRKPVGG
jgi:SAM-dependent methyltransferase